MAAWTETPWRKGWVIRGGCGSGGRQRIDPSRRPRRCVTISAFIQQEHAMSTTTARFEGVSVVCEANVFFDGKVVSHTVLFSDGSKKSLGLIYPGTYRFNTQVAEN